MTRSKTRKQQRQLHTSEERKPQNKTLRLVVSILITGVLLIVIGMMMLSRTMMPDTAFLKVPEAAISSAVTPAQGFFTGFVDAIADYFRKIKLRENLEQAYVDLLNQNEELYILAAQAQEYADRLAMYEDIDAEMQKNLGLNPIRCQVIGREQGNYFSTFTIDRGARDGIEPYMAVTISGALVGFTEKVSKPPPLCVPSSTPMPPSPASSSPAGIRASYPVRWASTASQCAACTTCPMITCPAPAISWSPPAWACPSPRASRSARCVSPPAAWKATSSTSSCSPLPTLSTSST